MHACLGTHKVRGAARARSFIRQLPFFLATILSNNKARWQADLSR